MHQADFYLKKKTDACVKVSIQINECLDFK